MVNQLYIYIYIYIYIYQDNICNYIFLIWQCVKTLYPCSSHQNSWVKMDVHSPKKGIKWY